MNSGTITIDNLTVTFNGHKEITPQSWNIVPDGWVKVSVKQLRSRQKCSNMIQTCGYIVLFDVSLTIMNQNSCQSVLNTWHFTLSMLS